MVDPTKGIGQIQNLPSNRTQNSQDTERRKDSENAQSAGATEPRDEVSISEEALSLAQAESTAAETRELLQREPQVTLAQELISEALEAELEPSSDES